MTRGNYFHSPTLAQEFDLIFASIFPGREATLEECRKRLHAVREMVQYFRPSQWVVTSQWNSGLEEEKFLQEHPRVEIAMCQVGFPFKGKTVAWGSHLAGVANIECTPENCPYGEQTHPISLSAVRRKNWKWRQFASLTLKAVSYLVGGTSEVVIGQVASDEEARKVYLELRGKIIGTRSSSCGSPTNIP